MKTKGFTLIELLIVVAIIAILAAIAVPNFLEAQTRSKIARCKSDMRTIAVGCESYMVDNNSYPMNMGTPYGNGMGVWDEWTEYLSSLSTPVAFLSTTKYKDPFAPTKFNSSIPPPPAGWIGSYFWIDYGTKNGDRCWGYEVRKYTFGGDENKFETANAFLLYTWGPDRAMSNIEWMPYSVDTTGKYFIKANLGAASIYDPTNGTVSPGDIGRFGGAIPIAN